MKLEDRTAIVTGASSGIGRAIAIEFAREGANIVLADVREESRVPDDDRTTLAAIEEDGGRAIFQRTDVTEQESVERLVDRTVEAYGGIDILLTHRRTPVQSATRYY